MHKKTILPHGGQVPGGSEIKGELEFNLHYFRMYNTNIVNTNDNKAEKLKI